MIKKIVTTIPAFLYPMNPADKPRDADMGREPEPLQKPNHLKPNLAREFIINKMAGFTLIEVLLALAILSIGLSSLLKSNTDNIRFTSRIKVKSVSHQIAMSAIASIQTNSISIPSNREATHSTRISGNTWYWRASIIPAVEKSLEQISVSVSPQETGPFTNRLIGYRYKP